MNNNSVSKERNEDNEVAKCLNHSICGADCETSLGEQTLCAECMHGFHMQALHAFDVAQLHEGIGFRSFSNGQKRLPLRKSEIYARATIRNITSAGPCDDPDHFDMGPERDEMQIDVESGPAEAFLEWYHQVNEYGLCRVGGTNMFIDLGCGRGPEEGEVIEVTFEEFFTKWLDYTERRAKWVINDMSRKALAHLDADLTFGTEVHHV
jgi:hypothetical protein